MMRIFSAFAVITLFTATAFAQPKGFNYDESKVPKYTLPDPLVCLDGTKVTDKATWLKKRRPEIVKLFEEHVYGRGPRSPRSTGGRVRILKRSTEKSSRLIKEILINVTGIDGRHNLVMTMLVYLPANAKGPVPTFLALNFRGNHTVDKHPGISVTKAWVRNDKRRGVTSHKASAKNRGLSAKRWSVDKILSRGYGLATIYYGDIVPDHKDGLKDGPYLRNVPKESVKIKANDWGAIAAWAWGLSRAVDWFQSAAEKRETFNTVHVDPKRVIVLGHSRLGKTALWAGAIDPRFAMVISNNSGCGGAALSRRAFGETVKRINTSFPHWFCGNFKKYNDNEGKLPVDQHMLISLIAPRPVYIASAQQDRWADPRGEFLSALHADPVYKLLGTKGLPTKTMPAVNKPVMGRIGYHIRTGKHDVTAYDWEQYLKFADMHLKQKK